MQNTSTDSAYLRLEKRFTRMARLGDAQSILGWDEAVMMPAGSSAARNESLAELAQILQDLLRAPEVADDLAAAEGEALSEWQRANVREMRRRYKRATMIPADLHRQLMMACMECEQAWRRLRGENNWKDFAPLLDKVLQLSREELKILAADQKLSLYDAALEHFSPGLRTEVVDRIFGELRGFLPDLTREILQRQQTHQKIEGEFPVEAQKTLAKHFMQRLGFSFENGRLDESHHPFCGGTQRDVRITTRYNTSEFLSSLMGVLHETGHALYEMNLPLDWYGQPVGQSCGMAIHESQSLFMEMQVCRSREFVELIAPEVQRSFAAHTRHREALDVDNLTRVVQHVERGYIRVDADEVTYPSHIILRYELERGLVEGSIQVNELPGLWNEKMQSLLGLSTLGRDNDGCMQDVHWPGGAFGYFPAYTFGAIIAAQLFSALQTDLPQVRERIRQGEFAEIQAWLRAKIWSQGSRLDTLALVQQAAGPLSVAPFRRHLEARYLK
ncbi:MAG TPA: carboxypeptidase M32 [Pseudobdellovibrionaceae bacterium]|nr:carboxypeptidase M32 [Pseudobdellovibrionaceae bacterium]